MTSIGPNAALHVDWTGSAKPGPPASIYFFKQHKYIRWDVDAEQLCDGYPTAIDKGWPGLLEACPGQQLSGALHVPGWNNRIYFFFHGQTSAVSWDVIHHRVDPEPMPIAQIMPSGLTKDGYFAPLYVDTGSEQKVYAFRADTYTRFTVHDGEFPLKDDHGYPRKIGDGWTGGLIVAPNCAVSVYWTSRSDALPRRKIYFFLGDLYTRWDVDSHSKNYRLDIPSGWPGWPDFD